MSNAQRIILILALIAIFVILAQRLDNFTGQPAPPTPTVEQQQQMPEPAVVTVTPENYPPPAAPEAVATEGPYPEPPTVTPTPEGYVEPGG